MKKFSTPNRLLWTKSYSSFVRLITICSFRFLSLDFQKYKVLQRRQADSIEIQQMKQTAREEKDRRKNERAILNREREARRRAEMEKVGFVSFLLILTWKLQREIHEQLYNYREQVMKLQEEKDKLSLYNERKYLHNEEIDLMQMQLSQK